MAFFFNNKCQYSGCGEKFGSLAELIQHVERVHIVMDDSEEVSGIETMVPMSKILPNNIHDVMMRPPVHRINNGPRLHPSVASVNFNNCESPIQLLNANGYDGAGPSSQSVLAPATVNSNANTPFQVPIFSASSNNSPPPFQSVVAQAKRGLIPKMHSMKIVGNQDAESFENDDIPSSSSAVKRKSNSSKISFSKKRISSINRNVEPSMAKTSDVPTQTTSASPPPTFNESTHIALSNLTPDEIVQNSVLRADHSQLKPFPCPIPGCNKRYKHLNGIRYHSELYERELEKNADEHKSD
ncbi:zinc finger protein sfp1-like [Teleopsis dalmanni]|uniref:zinc finger protein sfp1-like n=1 Tax=Teleopsis dalmanni TaxID=139649 RepID=UPI000D32C5C7|nr:zinc finger protein sfp1-like [Teleopsis dalmanni]XP_037957590.1 zinc finger protein sfp1-like [Teleopsis dalmanni]